MKKDAIRESVLSIPTASERLARNTSVRYYTVPGAGRQLGVGENKVPEMFHKHPKIIALPGKSSYNDTVVPL